MPRRELFPSTPVTLAVAEGATTPNPGVTPAVIFSSTTGTLMSWTGTAWRSLYLDPTSSVNLPGLPADPASPAAGNVRLYAREIVPGLTVPKVIRPSGVDSPVQDDIMLNRVQTWQGNGTVMVASNAAVLTVSAAGTAVTPAPGTARGNVPMTQYASGAAAGNLHTVISPSDSNAFCYRGGANGQGGFRYVMRFSLATLQAGNRGHWGIAASRTAATNVDPLTVAAPARVGLAINANTGNWFLARSDGTTAANQDLGANFPVNNTDLMELYLFCRPHDGASTGNIGWRVRRYTTTANAPAFEASGTLTANIPAATALLHPWWYFTNNTTAAAVAWQFNRAALQVDW